MFQIKKILFPTDFSERALGASHYAGEMAGRFQAELKILNVVGRREDVFFAPEFGGTSLLEQYENRMLDAKKAMKDYLKEEFEQFEVVREVLEGDPAGEIVRYAERNGTDLIMMPSHGYGVFRRYILGSVTAKVLHDAHCPVWTAAHTEHAPPLEKIRYRKVLCAVDLGPLTAKALAWANGFAQEHQAELVVVHAVAWEPLRAQAEESIDQLLSDERVAARVVVEEGEASKVVDEVAAREEADLLVISRGSAAETGRLRTNAYAIIRSSPCPVISV
jgi:nucleotide-binding universal stress UspA family protein